MSFTSPRWGDVYVAAAARAIDQGGTILAAFTLEVTLQHRGYGGDMVAALLLATALPPIVLARAAGRVADRYDSRAILLTLGSLQALIALALAFAGSLPAILALVAALSAGAAFTDPTFSALTPAMVGRENLARASGLIQSSFAIGRLGGPVLAGLLVGAFGTRVPLLIDAASFLAVPLAALLIKTRRGSARPPAEPGAVAESGTWSIWRDPVSRPVMLLFALVAVAMSLTGVVDVFMVLGTLHSTTTLYGVIGTVQVVGMLAGSALTGRTKLGDPRAAAGVVLALAAMCTTLALTGAVPAAGWMLPLVLVAGLANGALNVLVGTLIGRRAPADRRGRAFAVLGGVMNAASALGYVAGGLLMAVSGEPRAILIGSGLTGVAICAFLGAPLLVAARARREAVAA